MDLYEDVPYPGFPFPQTHPDRLALVGTLRGLRPAPPEACRVLELGCADGLNIVAMAAHSPGLHAVGLDRAGGPLARGRSLIERLGLTNVRLEELDVLDAGGELGEFDYVIAHGVYSWATDAVRDAVLRVCHECLAPDGQAFVSYNAFPGTHIRQMLREMALFHVGDTRDPGARVEQARGLYELMAPWAQERPDAYGQVIEHELKRLRGLPAHSLIHDDLGERYDGVWLKDFMDHASRHGLAFVAEAEHEELRYDRHPAGFDAVLDAVAPEDPVRWEQYSDFLSGRSFRQTVLCHAGLPLVRPADPSAPERLLSTLGPAAQSEHLDIRAGNGGGPPRILERAVDALKEAYPRPVAFDELVEITRTDPPAALGPALLSGFRRGLIDFRAAPPRYTTEPPQYPETSALMRLLAEEGRMLVSLRHELVNMDDPFGRFILRLLDGTRDREGLLDSLVAGIGSAIEMTPGGEPVVDGERLRSQIAAGLEHNLRSLASLGLLKA